MLVGKETSHPPPEQEAMVCCLLESTAGICVGAAEDLSSPVDPHLRQEAAPAWTWGWGRGGGEPGNQLKRNQAEPSTGPTLKPSHVWSPLGLSKVLWELRWSSVPCVAMACNHTLVVCVASGLPPLCLPHSPPGNLRTSPSHCPRPAAP